MALQRTSTPPPMIDTDAVASYFDVSKVTVRRWVREGRLRAYKVGPRAVRFDPRDLDKLRVQLAAPTYAHVSGGGSHV